MGAGRAGTMKAMVFHAHGGAEVLRMEDVPLPETVDDEVMVRVAATSVNHLDITVRDGSAGLKVAFPHIGGCDVAGKIVSVGPRVHSLGVGDEVVANPGLSCGVCDMCRRGMDSFCDSFSIIGEHRAGAFAEYVAVPERNLKIRPSAYPLVKAAAAPLVYLTAWHALVGRAGMRFGDNVLITGGSGGVSTAAIQIAKLFDARVVTTTRSEGKIDALRRLGADDVILTRGEGWAREYLHEQGLQGFDIALDSVGTALWKECLRSLRKGGRLVNYGRTSGGSVTADLSHLFWKQLQITGSTMGSASDFETVMNLVFNRRLDPVVDHVFSLREAGRAQEHLASASQIGKVVLVVGES